MLGSQITKAEIDSPLPVARTAPKDAPPVVARTPWMRRVGNLLILTGLALLLGLGGYWGLQTYTNDQTTTQINQQHQLATGLNFLPPPETGQVADTRVSGAVAPSRPTADDTVQVAEMPLPALNTNGVGGRRAGSPPSTPPTRLEIPGVGIDTAVVPVGWDMIPGKEGQAASRWQVAEYAAGHHAGSANPGQTGNVVISGHVDWKGEVFKNLHLVHRGDEV